MSKIIGVGYNYDDVRLIAQPGAINSRKQVAFEMNRIIVSGMTSIIGPTFIKACHDLPQEYQIQLHIPRDLFIEENLRLCRSLNYNNVVVGVGLNTLKIELLAKELNYYTVLLDCANGYLPSVVEKVKYLVKEGFKVIAGSVHTEIGFDNLAEAGALVIRSGIAPGSVCITSSSTGFTRGTVTEIMELDKAKQDWYKLKNEIRYILADGAFKTPSDYIKAFGCGADFCMGGRIFTEAFECRMHQDGTNIDERIIPIEGKGMFKLNCYFGMASKWGKIAMGKEVESIEGTTSIIEPKYSLKDIVTTLWQGIASGVSYSGHKTLSEFIGNGVFEIKY